MQRLRRLTAISAVAAVLAGCAVQESTRSGGLIAPTGPTVTAMPPVSTVTTAAAESFDAPTASALGPAESLVEPTKAAETIVESAKSAVEPSSDRSSESVTVLTTAADAPAVTAAPTIPSTTASDPVADIQPAADVQQVLAAADPPEGFSEGVLGVTGPAGTRVWPVIVADTPRSRQRGLMGVTDFASLGGYAAMVFIFEGDTSGAFWMRDTPLPLRITFVAANGSVVSATDMVPCLPPTPADDCEHYLADGPYRIAIEHPLGPAFDIGLMTAEFVEVAIE